MQLKLVCGICHKPLSIIYNKLNKDSIVLGTNICGYCESMAKTLRKELLKNKYKEIRICPLIGNQCIEDMQCPECNSDTYQKHGVIEPKHDITR